MHIPSLLMFSLGSTLGKQVSQTAGRRRCSKRRLAVAQAVSVLLVMSRRCSMAALSRTCTRQHSMQRLYLLWSRSQWRLKWLQTSTLLATTMLRRCQNALQGQSLALWLLRTAAGVFRACCCCSSCIEVGHARKCMPWLAAQAVLVLKSIDLYCSWSAAAQSHAICCSCQFQAQWRCTHVRAAVLPPVPCPRLWHDMLRGMCGAPLCFWSASLQFPLQGGCC